MSVLPLVMGIDVGTQGARVLVVDASGQVVALARRAFERLALPGLPDGYAEQDPEQWWAAVRDCVQECVAALGPGGRGPRDIVAAAVDSTSGTVVLLDEADRPIRPAIMYSDRRAAPEAEVVNAAAGEHCARMGYRFNLSFALPRLLWVARNEPEHWRRTRRVVHAADYIVGRLTGDYGASDQSNALKSGFDLLSFEWPQWIEDELGISRSLLPRVLLSGQTIARVSCACAEETGLCTSTQVVAGMTDGCADQVSSGACQAGDWNSVVGTTLVLKGLTREIVRDPMGRVYCHLHPSGHWMPGGASNVGARVLDELFPGGHRAALDAAALGRSPTPLTVFPLTGTGERFPINRPDAVGFVEGDPGGPAELYAAHLEGLACVERMAYEVVASLGAEVGGRLYTSGGGAASKEWVQIRADILGREIYCALQAGAAMGSAIVAASGTVFAGLQEATTHMVRMGHATCPRSSSAAAYADLYARFMEAMRHRGYVDA